MSKEDFERDFEGYFKWSSMGTWTGTSKGKGDLEGGLYNSLEHDIKVVGISLSFSLNGSSCEILDIPTF